MTNKVKPHVKCTACSRTGAVRSMNYRRDGRFNPKSWHCRNLRACTRRQLRNESPAGQKERLMRVVREENQKMIDALDRFTKALESLARLGA